MKESVNAEICRQGFARLDESLSYVKIPEHKVHVQDLVSIQNEAKRRHVDIQLVHDDLF